MVKANEFINTVRDCEYLLDMVGDLITYASDTIRLIGCTETDEEDNITKLAPYAEENIDVLHNSVKRISSLSDKLEHSLKVLKSLTK